MIELILKRELLQVGAHDCNKRPTLSALHLKEHEWEVFRHEKSEFSLVVLRFVVVDYVSYHQNCVVSTSDKASKDQDETAFSVFFLEWIGALEILVVRTGGLFDLDVTRR